MRTLVTTFALAMGVAFSAAALFADDKAPGKLGGGGGGGPAASAKVDGGAAADAKVGGNGAGRSANRAERTADRAQNNAEKAGNQNGIQAQRNLNQAENQADRAENQANRAENQAQRQIDRQTNQAERQLNRAENQADRQTDPVVNGNAVNNALRANNNRAKLNVDVNGKTRVAIGRDNYLDRKAQLGDREFDRRGIGPLDEAHFANRSDSNWRFRRWGNEWWYWVPTGSWMFYRDGRWNNYDADSYVDIYTNPAYANPAYGNAGQVSANFNGPYYEDQSGFYYLQSGRKVYDPQIHRVGDQLGANITQAPR